MSAQKRYGRSVAQRGQDEAGKSGGSGEAGESAWQRDYGRRSQRFEPAGRAVAPNPDYSGDSSSQVLDRESVRRRPN